MRQNALVMAGLFAGLALFSASSASGTETPVQLKLDEATTIADIGVACTGIGGTKNDPKWGTYPVRVEFANPQHEYLLNAVTVLSDASGAPIFSVFCPGPWLLLKLPDSASYRLEASLNGEDAPPQSAVVKAPTKGQSRIVLTFPGM